LAKSQPRIDSSILIIYPTSKFGRGHSMTIEDLLKIKSESERVSKLYDIFDED